MQNPVLLEFLLESLHALPLIDCVLVVTLKNALSSMCGHAKQCALEQQEVAKMQKYCWIAIRKFLNFLIVYLSRRPWIILCNALPFFKLFSNFYFSFDKVCHWDWVHFLWLGFVPRLSVQVRKSGNFPEVQNSTKV